MRPLALPFRTAATLAWALTACAESTAAPDGVAVLEITPLSQSFASLGDTARLVATPKNQEGAAMSGKQVSWSSSAPAIASVDGEGLVTAAGNGSAEVTATVDGVSASAAVSVSQVAHQLEITPASATLAQGVVDTLDVRVEDARGAVIEAATIAWTVTDPNVARVDPRGVLIALRPGPASVIAAAGDARDTTALVVEFGWMTIASSLGWHYACGIGADSLVYCWGANEWGQLGDGTKQDRAEPTPVAMSAARFIDIALGTQHSCALTAAGQVYCWGTNNLGQVGDGTQQERTIPTLVAAAAPFVDIVAGGQHNCGRTQTGLQCWGSNEIRQLGRPGGGTGDHASEPVTVHESYSFSSLAAGILHTCGIQDGAAYCWGWNEYGQLGQPTGTVSSATPVKAGVETSFQSIGAGYLSSCGSDASGLYCWGGSYQGTGHQTSNDPRVISSQTFERLAPAQWHMCGLVAGGLAYCWGTNWSGQLGDGTREARSAPVPVLTGMRFLTVGGGGGHTCAIGRDRYAYCWGANDRGQLGVGMAGDARDLPTRVKAPASVAP